MTQGSNVNIAITADNEAGKAIAQVTKQLDTVAESLKGIEANTKDASDMTDLWHDAIGNLAGGLGEAALDKAFEVGKEAVVDLAQESNKSMNMMQAQLGLTKEQAQDLGKVAINVFKDNFGSSLGDASDAITLVSQRLKGLSPDEVQGVTENALRLRDAFGVDVGESVSAVSTLMQNFGLTSDQAFDFVSSGFQKGLNSSDDFLDSINEYSTQFKSGGATADQFFSLMQTGLANGVLGTDKASDSFKEFRLRIQDGSKTTAEGLASIGLNATTINDQINSGAITVADAYQMVVTKLKGVDDQSTVMQAGTALLGTQFEDLGIKGALAIDLTATKMSDLSGSTKSLDAQYNDFTNVMAGAFRQIQAALIPVGTQVLQLGTVVMPFVATALSGLVTGFTDLITSIESGVNIAVAFMTPFITSLPQIFGFLQPLADFFSSNFTPILTAFAITITGVIIPALYAWIAGQVALLAQSVATGIGIAVAFAPITLTILGITAVLALLFIAWQSNFLNIQGITQTVLGAIMAFIQMVLATIQAWWSAHGEQVMAVISALWGTLQALFQAGAAFISGVISTVLAAILSFWNQHGAAIIGFITSMWATVQAIFTTALNIIQAAISTFIGIVVAFWSAYGDQLMSIARSMWAIVQAVFNLAFGTISGLFKAFTDLLSGNWSGFAEDLKGIWTNLWYQIGVIIGNAWNALSQTVSVIVSGIKTAFTSVDWGAIGTMIMTGISSFAKFAWASISQGVADAIKAAFNFNWTSIGTAIMTGIISFAAAAWSATAGGVVNAIKAAFNINWGSIGGAIINGIIGAINNGIPALIQAAKDAAWAAFNAFMQGLGAHSPSRKFAYAADMAIEGFTGRLAKGEGAIAGATTNLANTAVQGMYNGLGQTGHVVSNSTTMNIPAITINFTGDAGSPIDRRRLVLEIAEELRRM